MTPKNDLVEIEDLSIYLSKYPTMIKNYSGLTPDYHENMFR